jgi:MFS family permease
MTAISFSDVSVISVLIVQATGSLFLAGIFQTLRMACFFIPQLLSVNIGAKPYKKKILLQWTTISRCCLLIAVFSVFLTNNIQLVVLSFFISFALFPIFDGLTIVPYLEFVAKSMPSTKRGSFFGFSQSVGAIGAVAGGFLVSTMLRNPTFIFPKNYGMLILIEWIMLLCGLSFIFLLKEKPDEKSDDEKSLVKNLRNIPRILKENETIRRLAVIQLLISFFIMATPFYSVYALSKLIFEEGLIGYFISFQMVGRLIFSLIWAHLCNRGRNKQIIQYTGLMFLASFILAVVVGILPLPVKVVEYCIMLLFLLLGGSMGGVFLGFNNYVLEMEDRRQRQLILGLLNSLNVITSILPLLGGVMIEYLPYEAVFLVSAVPISFGLALTRNLKQKISAS